MEHGIDTGNHYVVPASQLKDGGENGWRNLDVALGHIILGDALDVLRKLPSDSIHLIHTSPPYNIDRPYLSELKDAQGHDAYEEFLSQCIHELKRVVRPGGSIFWQTGYTMPDSNSQTILPLDLLAYPMFIQEPNPLQLWDRIIWRYFGGHAFRRKFTNKHESILWFVKPGAEPTFDVDAVRERSKEYDKRNNFWGRNPGNVWEVDRVAFGSSEQTSHIAVFPEEISERIVRACSRPGDVVLDPFAGSGTLPKVAHSLERQWIGIEISEEYAHEASVRIGYQQRSEVDTLAAELIKTICFRDAQGVCATRSIVDQVGSWVARCDLDSHSSKFLAEVEHVFADGSGRNSLKAQVWTAYDSRFENRNKVDPVVLADSLLGRRYKLRKELNGVSKYRSALAAIEGLAQKNQSPEVWATYVNGVLRAEPSTFRVFEDTVELSVTDRQLVRTTSDEALEPDADSEQQGRLLG